MKIKFIRIIPLCFCIAFSNLSISQSLDPNLLSYINSKGHRVPVKTLYEWQIKRGQILDSMQAFFGKFPGDPDMPPFNSRLSAFPPFNTVIIDSIETTLYIRYNIRFTVAKDEDVLAYLYVPKSIDKNKKRPAVLALTPTTGRVLIDTKIPYARELVERGYIVLGPEYPGTGDLKNYDFKTDRYESGVMKGIFNHIRCVDFLQGRADVDPERIGAIGHSLGGHSSMYLAAFDTRIKVIVSSCGWTLNRYYNNYNKQMEKKWGGSKMWGYTQERYCPLALTKYNLKVENFPYDLDEVIAALAPRPFFSNSPIHDANFNVEGVRVGIANVSEVYHFLNADNNLQVRYPVAGHDFPPEIRFESYNFLDKYLKE